MAVPENYAEICKERSAECRKSLLATLDRMKIQRVTADYSGSGDEGAIESVEFYADAEMQTPVPVDEELEDTVEALFTMFSNPDMGTLGKMVKGEMGISFGLSTATSWITNTTRITSPATPQIKTAGQGQNVPVRKVKT
jgi:hypothetical protein